VKVYAAYKAAVEHQGQPTVILAKTVKGYGLGGAGEGMNTAHQAKKVAEQDRLRFAKRFNLGMTDDQVIAAEYCKPAEESPEIAYLKRRRKALGGYVPQRRVNCPLLKPPSDALIEPFAKGSGGRPASTTMVLVDLLKRLIADKELGKYIVPIIPDEARTFGMQDMFTRVGIYSSVGQLYEPVDAKTLTSYREAKNGQLLEEGITEAGAMCSFIAAGTAYANAGVPTIPFYIYYSMFGFQRIGDLIWAAADQRCRGFLLGGTAGRTTLMGEGLQHQDGHSLLAASTVPNVVSYDPAFAYEIALIVQDGIRRMYQDGESIFYYLTLYNENYPMEPMPEGSAEGILRGLYRFRASPRSESRVRLPVHLLASGPIVREALRAQEVLGENYGIAADVWSVTSYTELRRDALDCERWNRLHPTQQPRKSYLEQTLADQAGVYVAASDYMKLLAESIGRWVPGGLVPLGTDGFGRSENRASLRRFFEVDAESIVAAVLDQLFRRGEISAAEAARAIQDLGLVTP
jgi:pyruvate dehydrogenase E1 component